jgi:hypothetical protein
LLPAAIYWAGMRFWIQGGRHARPVNAAELPGKLITPNL